MYENEKAFKILSDVKIMCLEHSKGKSKDTDKDEADGSST